MLRLILIVCAGASLCAASYSDNEDTTKTYHYDLPDSDTEIVIPSRRETRCNKGNEILKCVNECPPQLTCQNKHIGVSCAEPTEPCEHKCVCQDGYFRNAVGDCVLSENCEERCNRRYEIPKCVNKCPPEKTCRNKNIYFNCVAPTEPCEVKCVCQDGYFRNAVGDCISEENCDRCPGDHEYFACSGFCDNVCSELDRQNKTSCPVATFVCSEKCYCEDGYARNPHNNCVPIKYCQEAALCDKDEVFTECKTTCPPDTCESILAFYDCSSTPPCRPGCHCRDGYLRYNSTSRCKPSKTCPQLMYMNENQ